MSTLCPETCNERFRDIEKTLMSQATVNGNTTAVLDELRTSMDALNITVDRILEQTTKTNGRVTYIEKDIAKENLSSRVRKLEDGMLKIITIATIVGVISSTVIGVATKLIR
jgi:hypothetical protein